MPLPWSGEIWLGKDGRPCGRTPTRSWGPWFPRVSSACVWPCRCESGHAAARWQPSLEEELSLHCLAGWAAAARGF